MKGFYGERGRFYSDSQRKAMFAKQSCVSIPRILDKISGIYEYDPKNTNRFVLPAVAATIISSAASGAGSALGQRAAGTVMGAPGKFIGEPVKFVGHVGTTAVDTGMTLATPALGAAGMLLGSSFETGISEIGEPAALTNSQWMMSGTDAFGLPIMSRSAIDVNRVRKVVKKQYPNADVDARVVMLPPDKYMDVALSKNPGRENEAMISNGFYSPTEDTSYLEADDNKVNVLRAMIHEMVHDMSDDGVDDDGSKYKYMLNEGYADYVAKKIMTQELNIPEGKAVESLGYPKEVGQVEALVDEFGRKNVDRAFLKYHTLDSLKLKTPLLGGLSS